MKKDNTEGSANSLGNIIKDIRQKAKVNPLFISGLKKFVNLNLEQLKEFVNPKQILKLISGKEKIFLTTKGVEEFESIWNSRSEFNPTDDGMIKFIDEKFSNHTKTYTRGPRPKSIEVKVYELDARSCTSAMLGSFGEDLYLLSLTQHEILEFIRHHKEYLNIPTFFLYKHGSDGAATFHVAQVMVHKEGCISISLVGLCVECGFGPGDRRIVVRKSSVEDIDVKLRS
jgi:hypothetical protein